MGFISYSILQLLWVFTLTGPVDNDKANRVQMIENKFSPPTITISAGETVLWVNKGNDMHTATSGTDCIESGIWDSGRLRPGSTFKYTFREPGTYPYFCIPHCKMGMVGKVIVK